MVVNGNAEHLLCSFLADYKLVQVVLERSRGDLWGAYVRSFPQRALGLAGLVVACEAMT